MYTFKIIFVFSSNFFVGYSFNSRTNTERVSTTGEIGAVCTTEKHPLCWNWSRWNGIAGWRNKSQQSLFFYKIINYWRYLNKYSTELKPRKKALLARSFRSSDESSKFESPSNRQVFKHKKFFLVLHFNPHLFLPAPRKIRHKITFLYNFFYHWFRAFAIINKAEFKVILFVYTFKSKTVLTDRNGSSNKIQYIFFENNCILLMEIIYYFKQSIVVIRYLLLNFMIQLKYKQVSYRFLSKAILEIIDPGIK